MEDPKKIALIENFLSSKDEVRFGKMFGYPAYYVGSCMFACLYDGFVGLKVPEKTANEARELPSISDFQPKGKKKMREWVQFALNSDADLSQHQALIEAAIQYGNENFIKKQEGK